MRILFIVFFAAFLFSCSGMPLKTMSEEKPREIELSVIAGNLNVDRYKTISRITVHAKSDKGKEKLTEKKLELSTFNLNRQSYAVNEAGHVNFKYWVTDVEGDIDLSNMGLPPRGKTLIEAVNKKAEVLAVKGFPEETIFYLPKIALPKNAVKPGDTWKYENQWRSLKTGWPFQLNLNLVLKNWVSCGGLRCAHITYEGAISLPESSPLKGSTLNSEIKGEFVYAPVGHQFIWAKSQSVEVFIGNKKRVEVKSCTVSYQKSPNKESGKFVSKFNSSCN